MKNIRELPEQSVGRGPETAFLVFEDERLTLRGFLLTVTRVANGLMSLGVKKGDKVAILLPNCLEFPYSWLAASMIVANHGGWPWVDEMVAVAWKRRNVYIEIGGISPKYIAKPGSGWEAFLTCGNSLLQDQILFATDSLFPDERVVKERELLPLEDQIKEKLLYKSAMRVLNLCSS